MSDAPLTSSDKLITSETAEPVGQAYKIALLPGNPGSVDPGSDLGSAFTR